MDWTTIIVGATSALLGGGAVLVAVVKGWFQRPLIKAKARKIDAEREAIVSEVYQRLADERQEDNRQLRIELQELRDEFDAYRAETEEEMQKLRRENKALREENGHLQKRIATLEQNKHKYRMF